MNTLNDEQKATLETLPDQALEMVIKDLTSSQFGLHPITFAIAMSSEFRKPNITPAGVVAYCREVLERRTHDQTQQS